MPTLVEEIRCQIASDQFEFSKHAVDQSILRSLRVQEIKEEIATGSKSSPFTSLTASDGAMTLPEGEVKMTSNWNDLNQEEPDRFIETPVYNFAA